LDPKSIGMVTRASSHSERSSER